MEKQEAVNNSGVVVEDDRTGMDPTTLERAVWDHLLYTCAKDKRTAKKSDLFRAMAFAVRDRLIHRWMRTQQTYYREDVKRVYYLSAEYLLGRALGNNLLNLGLYDVAQGLLSKYGIDLSGVLEVEHDPGLGNGGLGRLAACFLDSLATLELPAMGYGIRYEYGIFQQAFRDGWQVELGDPWLRTGNPWEIARPDHSAIVQFYGRVEERIGPDGRLYHAWVDTQNVLGVPYDMPVAGFGNHTVNTLRLWSAQATQEFNLGIFNAGDFRRAVEEKVISETISKVLYPADNNPEGRELRLRQQYFFVCCAIHDIVRRYKKTHSDFKAFPEKVAIQLNDTHPAVAIAELMRVLVDVEGMDWDEAWSITERAFGYTNHTLLPEALERWPVAMFQRLLPRHLQIIFEINHRFLRRVHIAAPNDFELQRRVSIIDESGERYVRMAHLAVIGSHSVNGVAALHSDLVKSDLFPDFVKIWPKRFNNKTNGVTPRRWLLSCNPMLSAAITERIGPQWVTHLEALRELEAHADDEAFLQELMQIKRRNKERLLESLGARSSLKWDVDAIFDVQVKRIHEYKRQLLNCLHVITLYQRIKGHRDAEVVPRLVLFGGKAAPGYAAAKLLIKLINDIADIVNADPDMQGRLRVVMPANYGVSMAERIIPAADLSEQISTAGMEASGTGNMKFTMNGALTIGTLDGANIEIREEVGAENFFLFGLKEEEVKSLKRAGYDPTVYIQRSPALQQALELLESGFFSPDDRSRFQPVVRWLRQQDPFMLCADFDAYVACQGEVEQAYLDPMRWAKMVLYNIARVGKFSSDRTISEYAKDIWSLRPVSVKL